MHPAQAEAIGWFEHMAQFEAAGFTRDEAFELTSEKYRAYMDSYFIDRFLRRRQREEGS